MTAFKPWKEAFLLKVKDARKINIEGKTCIRPFDIYLVFCQDYGRPMRMSYSAISDPCLSSEVLQLIDKITLFYKVCNPNNHIRRGYSYSIGYTYTYF